MSRFCMISFGDRGNLGARQLVARAKALGHDAFLVNYGEYLHETYAFSDDGLNPASVSALQGILLDLNPTIHCLVT